jgi:hypothetical protein
MKITAAARFDVICRECGPQIEDLDQERAWDEAMAHERGTGHETFVAKRSLAAYRA